MQATHANAYTCDADANMLQMLDNGVQNVTQALTTKGLWATTLLVFTAE